MTRHLIGIYVHDSGIELVGLKYRNARETRVASESIEIGAREGWEKALQRVPELTIDFKEKCGFQKAFVSIALPRQAAMVREMRFPKETRENLAGAVRFELPRCMPIAVEQIHYDFQEVATTPEKQICVLLVAMLREPLAPLWALNESADLNLHALTISTTALVTLRNWKLKDEAPPTQAMLVTHHGISEFMVISEGRLRYAKILPAPEPDGPPEIPDLMHETQLAESRMGIQIAPFDLMLVVPEATSHNPAHAEFQTQAMGITRVPPATWDSPTTDMLVAQGAALMGMQAQTESINLIPETERRQPSRFGQQLAITLSLILLILLGTWWGVARHKGARRELELDQKIVALDREVRAIEATKSQITALNQRLAFLSETVSARQQKLDVIDRLSRVIPNSAWIESLDIRSDQVILKGFAEAASELLPLLEAEPIFQNVVFLSSITRDKDGKERFRLSIDLVH